MNVRMPWGKFRGQPLTAIDGGYLRWVASSATATRPWLREAVLAELFRRGCAVPPKGQQQAPVDLRGVIRKWHHEMAARYHPDRGGSTDAMQAINHAADRLKELLGA
jgi:hypothetical protein